MQRENHFYLYGDDGVSFVSKQAAKIKAIYAPLCGASSDNIKSSITPFLSGDIKLDKNSYVTKPASREDLRFDVRNFFAFIEGKGAFSLAQESSDGSAIVEIGQLYQKLTRTHESAGIEMQALNFVPVTGENVELMRISIKNVSDADIKFTPTAGIPLFGRGLSNKHDHEHVTALLHRSDQHKNGVIIEPSMSFDESGHMDNDNVYFVFGCSDKGKPPTGTFPTMENFCGEAGNISAPEAVLKNLEPRALSEEEINGKEVVGALRFEDYELKPEETKEYLLVIGIGQSSEGAEAVFNQFNTTEAFDEAFKATKEFWQEKSNAIEFKTADADFNSWMRWVTIQPVLRRIYGCSFLPDHDYGKGGKGWRDIWQDLLSLILIEPEGVRESLINNFAGVRIDGSNATVIGSGLGKFIADRNAITRVWMDHGAWPFLTTALYIDQTGDYEILLHENTYFRDHQLSRNFEKDESWNDDYGNKLKDISGNVHSGTILEHILIQHLVQFFNVGDHNNIRLESADWNDGLDMAFEKGESAAFTCLYAGNLFGLANLIETLANNKSLEKLNFSKEILTLLDTLGESPCDYDNAQDKRRLLFKNYFPSVQPSVSGVKVDVAVDDLVSDLRAKGSWIFDHIKKDEKITVKGKTWFNGYYDNKGARVEGDHEGNIRMTLTGQVFPLMSGLADHEEITQVIESVNEYLKDKNLQGFRLNSQFDVRHYSDLGRAFSFAYGTKENGAFFSHMIVMYAYSLYKRGFVHEGHNVLRSIYNMCMDTEKSKIYPGIPEYFDSQGRGMYHYLTGSASWFILTQLTQVFGVRGQDGELLIDPKLVKEEFDENGLTSVKMQFAGIHLEVIYENKNKKDYGQYSIKEIYLNDKLLISENLSSKEIILQRSVIENAPDPSTIKILLD